MTPVAPTTSELGVKVGVVDMVEAWRLLKVIPVIYSMTVPLDAKVAEIPVTPVVEKGLLNFV